ncbi:MAG: AMP-binding protein, partial [Acidobacteria bacterium]|nr:AMP-binding protein [Acidobacteriota bacterium]
MGPERGGSRGVALAPRQEELWLRHQLAEGSRPANGLWAFLLRGPQRAAQLAAALRRVVERQATFRSAFEAEKGTARLWVSPGDGAAAHHVDLSRLPIACARRKSRELAAGLDARPFDLAHPPLLRALSVTLGRQRGRLWVSFPGLVADSLSQPFFLRDLAAALETPEEVLPPLPLSIGELTLQESVAASSPAVCKLERRFRHRLVPKGLGRGAGVKASPGWLVAFREPPAPRHRLFLPPPTGGRSRSELTPVLTAALSVLLARWSGECRVIVAALAEYRPPAVAEVVGALANPIPFPVEIDEELTFEALERGLTRRLQEARRLAPVPFREASRSRDWKVGTLGGTPRLLISWETEGTGELSGGGLRLRGVRGKPSPWNAFFDLELQIRPERRGAFLELAADAFGGSAAQRFRRHLRSLVEAAAGNPRAALRDLPWLSPAERHQVLAEWSRRQVSAELGSEASLLKAFEQQVARNGEAPAVLSGEERWTYRALDRLSGALARWLKALGVKPLERVGTAVEDPRVFSLAAVALAKLGAVWVPLDLRLPPRRLQERIRAQGLAAVVSDEGSEAFLKGVPLPKLVVDPRRLSPGAELPTLRIPPSAPAYVAFDAPGEACAGDGLFSHRATVARCRRPGLGAILALDPLSSEAAFLSLWGALLQGRCWIGRQVEEGADPRALESLLERRWIGSVIVGEEGFALLERVGFHRFRGVRVQRLSGIHGAPLAAATYLLDRTLEPVPCGVPGRLWLGGATLPQCVGDNPRRTAGALIPNPFSQAPGDRLLSTHLIGSWSEEGRLEGVQPGMPQEVPLDPRQEMRWVEGRLRRHRTVLDCSVRAEVGSAGSPVLVAEVVCGVSLPRVRGKGPQTREPTGPCLRELGAPARGRVLEVGAGSLEAARTLA